MHRQKLIHFTLTCFLASSTFAQKTAPSPTPPADSSGRTVACRVMEVFVAQRQGVNAVIFHQRDKTDGPRLGEMLKTYSGEEMEFKTGDGQRHHGTVVRMKSCFGRGLLVFSAGEAKLGDKDEFILRFPENN